MKRIILFAFFAMLSTTCLSDEIDISESERVCLTKALYHEARGETDKGMFEVASVILNRKGHPKFPSDVCSVINQKGQFSFDKKAPMHEKGALERARSIVEAVKLGFKPLSGYIFFHRYDVKGMCTNKKNKRRTGDHVFCE